MSRTFFRVLLFASCWSLAGCRQEEAVPGVPPGRTLTYSAQIGNAQILAADLLLVVSNAPSMRAKQEMLIAALPGMIRRLVWPSCVDSLGNVTERTETCPEGTSLEFAPYRELHVGVITSSLGGHGSAACPRTEEGMDDRALFIPKVRSGVPDPDGTGFLRFHGDSLSDLEEFIANLTTHVRAVGTGGCPAPAPLEAWYRALVDPSPPAEIVVANGLADARRTSDGDLLLDEAVLAQRQQFLRPTSLVSIVVVSDQDDCSLMDGGVVYHNAGLGHRLLDTASPMPRASDACATNPNDACCFSCANAAEAPEECDAKGCAEELDLPPELDRSGVRCFDTKRRFGVDFAYPIERYVHGLTRARVLDDHSGELVENPLLRGSDPYGDAHRDPGLVFLTGIVGVPWQDVATEESLSDPATLELVSAAELAIRNVPAGAALVSRWDVMLGEKGRPEGSQGCLEDDPTCGAAPIPPLDPFLLASIEPRPVGLTNPISGDAIVSSSSSSPFANNINGHEADALVALPALYPDGGPARDRLQASCIFPLAEPSECEPDDPDCLCSFEPSRNAAACSPPAGGPATSTQYFAEASPPPRLLQVLRNVGRNSVVGSICPKITTGSSAHPSFGFNPTLEALTWSSGPERGSQGCFSRELPVDEEGRVPCIVVETWPKEALLYEYGLSEEQAEDPCALEGRSEVDLITRRYIEDQLQQAGRCGGASVSSCEDYHVCALDQLEGAAAEACQTDPDVEDSGPAGFCYVDPELTNEQGQSVAGGGIEGGNRLVANCPATERRLLRFVGKDTPLPRSVTLIACQTEELSRDPPEIPPDPAAP